MPIPAPITPAELRRLAVLRDLKVLDTLPEPLLDSLTRMAADICGAPIALISLVDEERQWFKSNFGLPGVHETPRDVAFCTYAIERDGVTEIPDALLDQRFVNNPLVLQAPHIRFYAGSPLVLPEGERVGTLCVIDRQPRQLEAAQLAMLQSLATMVVQALTLRRSLLDQISLARDGYEAALEHNERYYRSMVEAQSEMLSLAWPDGRIFYTNAAYAENFGLQPADMVGKDLFDYVELADRDAVRHMIQEVFEQETVRHGENRMVTAQGTEKWVAWTNSFLRDQRQRPYLHSVGRDITAQKVAEQALRAGQQLLERTGRVAGVGGWSMELGSGRVSWSGETHHIHEVEPGYVPTLDTAMAFYPPEAREVLKAAVAHALQTGEAWDLELPFTTAKGRSIWVRALGEVEYEHGAAVRLVGAFQDITERIAAREALRLLTAIQEHTTDMVVQTNAQGQISYMNPAVRRQLGFALDAPVEHLVFSTFNTPQTNALYASTILPAVKAHGVWIGESTVLVAHQRVVPVSHMVIAHRNAAGQIQHFSAIMRDISEQAQARLALVKQTATLRSITESLPALVAVVGADGRYQFVNSAFERWYRLGRGDILGRTLQEFLGDDEYAKSLPMVRKVMAGETLTFEKAYPLRNPPSHVSIHFIPLWSEAGQVDGFVTMAQDITEHRQETGRLLELSQRDPLTGLLNRAGLQAYMQQSLHTQDGRVMTLLCIDLDYFKQVNDQHGHPVGDQLLQAFAQRLRGLVRPTDAVARLGGDEFAVVLPNMPERSNAEKVAIKILGVAQAPFNVAGQSLRVDASVGIACGLDSEYGWAGLMARADAMLYQAKGAGRGRFEGP